MSNKYSRVPEVLVYVAGGFFLALYAYVAIKDALQPPKVTKRRMQYDVDENDEPIYDDDCDIDATLNLWKEQNRLIRMSM